MSGGLRRAIGVAADGLVRVESALLERPARSLDEIGVPIVVASHRRSGTHLTLDLLRRNFPACRPRMLPLENPHCAYFNIDRFEATTTLPCDEKEALRLLSKARRPSVKTHATADFPDVPGERRAFVEALMARGRVIYVHREGKKVMCSMWTWRRVFDPSARVPFSEFIRQTDGRGRSRPRVWSEHVAAWRGRDGVLSVDFDRLVRVTREVLAEIGAFIGERPEIAEPPLPRSNTTRLESTIARLTGNLTSTNQHAAGDKPPRPEEIFSADDLAFFERETAPA